MADAIQFATEWRPPFSCKLAPCIEMDPPLRHMSFVATSGLLMHGRDRMLNTAVRDLLQATLWYCLLYGADDTAGERRNGISLVLEE